MSQVLVRSSKPTPWSEVLNPIGGLKHLWGYRELTRQMVIREIASKNKGTQLGFLWAILEPAIRIAVYTFVFGVVLQFRGQGGASDDPVSLYALKLVCGFMVYGVFAESTANATTMVTSRANFVRKVVFPLEILPIAGVTSAAFYSLIGLVLVMIAAILIVGQVSATLYLFPLVFAPLMLFSLGASWFFASLGVFVRDMRQVVMVVIGQLLFFMTPIIYTIDMVPARFAWIIKLNPMTWFVEFSRDTLIWGHTPDWGLLGGLWGLSLMVAMAGYVWFMKSKRGFADVL